MSFSHKRLDSPEMSGKERDTTLFESKETDILVESKETEMQAQNILATAHKTRSKDKVVKESKKSHQPTPIVVEEGVIGLDEPSFNESGPKNGLLTRLRNLIQIIVHTVIGTTATMALDVKNVNTVLGIKTSNAFKGYSFTMKANLFRNTIMFGTMPTFQELLNPYLTERMAQCLAFGFAGAAEQFFWTPISVARQKIMTTDAETIRDVITKSGRNYYASVYKGAIWGALRNFTFAVPFMGVYKLGEDYFIDPMDTPLTRILKTIPISGVAGLVSIGSYPLGLIQMKIFDNPKISTRELFSSIYKEEGFQGFWKGAKYTYPRMMLHATSLGLATLAADQFATYAQQFSIFSVNNSNNRTAVEADAQAEVYAPKRKP